MAKTISIKAVPSDPPVPAHAILSPSGSSRWIACPGSIAASANIPSKPSSKYAAEGTAAHSLLEACLVLDQDPEEFIGHEIEEGFLVTEEMAHAVGAGVDFVRERMAANPALRLHIEVRVKPGNLFGLENGECEGTADIILEDGRMCIVADYKHGQGIYVEVKDNSQLMLYCGGARQFNGKPFFKYESVVIQPRNYGKNGRPIRSSYFTESELVNWLQKIVRPSAHAALQPNAPRRAGDHCHWCPAGGQCRERARYAASMASKEFGPVDPTEGELMSVSDPNDLTPTQLAKALQNSHRLEAWIKAIREYAFEQLKAGKTVPGYKLGYGARKRIWKSDAEKELAKTLTKKGFKHEEVYTPEMLISPAQLEILLKARNMWPVKPRGGERPPTLIDPFIDYTSPDMRLMPTEAGDPVSKAAEAADEFKPVPAKKGKKS